VNERKELGKNAAQLLSHPSDGNGNRLQLCRCHEGMRITSVKSILYFNDDVSNHHGWLHQVTLEQKESLGVSKDQFEKTEHGLRLWKDGAKDKLVWSLFCGEKTVKIDLAEATASAIMMEYE
jgi:hypothetical protein